ncbi:MAG: hypothetical protein Q8930_02895 [Bacillota bacterium]|nr:hypothetical protein [Bacillota bacterium]
MMKKEIRRRNSIVTSCVNIIFPLCLTLGISMMLHGYLNGESGLPGGILLIVGVSAPFASYGGDGVKKMLGIDRFAGRKTVKPLALLLGSACGIVYLGAVLLTYMAQGGKDGQPYGLGAAFWVNFSLGFKVLGPIGFLLIVIANALDSDNED